MAKRKDNKKDDSDVISFDDFKEFLNAKTYEEQLRILAIHSQKNQQRLKKEKKEMKNNEEKKEGFFKKAFREMGESAKAQHAVDKANLQAAKAEAKANFEENRGTNTLKRAKADAKQHWDDAHMSPAERTAKTRLAQEKQILESNERKAAAEAITAEAKKVRAEELAKKEDKKASKK